MVEGHQVARTAAAHRATLVGRRFRATSPNGRFSQGARDVDSCRLLDVQSVGKNLFYFFEAKGRKGSEEEREGERQTVAVHFGMSGRARVARKSSEPETTPTTRLRLVEEVSSSSSSVDGNNATTNNKNNNDTDDGNLLTLHIACMTLLHSPDESLWRTKRVSLGPDPLREDADREVAFASMLSPKNRKKSVGFLLMDQAVVAGIGNIYRAEICHLGRVHPETPAGLLSREELEELWEASVRTLRDGFESGSIVTVRDGRSEAPHDPTARRFVYNRESCATCGDRVVSFDINSRTAYACLSCQPLRAEAAAALTPARKREVFSSSAAAAKLFASRCAPDEAGSTLAPLHPSKMTVAQLRSVLEANGIDSKGLKKKAELVQRLEEHRSLSTMTTTSKTPATTATATKRERLDDEEDALAARLSTTSSSSLSLLGTRGLVPATPAAAAEEKLRAGEKGNVEHVAQAGDDVATAFGPVTPAPKAQRKRKEEAKKKQRHD